MAGADRASAEAATMPTEVSLGREAVKEKETQNEEKN